jgi:hypothetical protein
MAGTIIQIKRGTTTAAPASLANGELAFSGNLTSNSLFIGSPDGGTMLRIAGGAFGFLWNGVVGTLTANATPITDANSFVSNVKSSGLYLGPTALAPGGISVTTINAVANSTALGTPSNTELTTTWAIKTYVDGKVAGSSGSPGGANTQIQFNDSSSFAGSAGYTFIKTTNSVNLANTLFLGAGTANVIANNTLIQAANSTQTANHSVAGFVVGTSTVNATAISSGANVILSTTTLSVGNSTVNTVANSTDVTTTTLHARDATFTGNLTVSGTTTTLDTTTLKVSNNFIELADAQTTVDNVDIGYYGSFGNSTVIQYTGMFRDHADTGKYKLFTTQKPPTSTVDTANNTYALATLNAFLLSGGFVANSLGVTLTANSTYFVNMTANSLTLTTPLVVGSGGTGQAALTASAVLLGNGSGPISNVSSSTAGHVLQITGGVPVFGMVDCGTF